MEGGCGANGCLEGKVEIGKAPMYRVAAVCLVCAQSGSSTLLVKDYLHGGNRSFPVQDCRWGGAVYWENAPEGFPENLVQAGEGGIYSV